MAKKYHGMNDKDSANRKASPGAMDSCYSMAHAGMPEDKVMKEYPSANYGSPEEYNDSREGIDMLAKDAHKQMMKKTGGRY